MGEIGYYLPKLWKLPAKTADALPNDDIANGWTTKSLLNHFKPKSYKDVFADTSFCFGSSHIII